MDQCPDLVHSSATQRAADTAKGVLCCKGRNKERVGTSNTAKAPCHQATALFVMWLLLPGLGKKLISVACVCVSSAEETCILHESI